MIRSFAILFGLLAVAYADLNIAYAGNVSGSITSSGLSYRATDLEIWGLGDWSGASFSSVSVNISKGSATVDLVTGAANFDVGIVPYSYLAYFTDSTQWTGGKGIPVNASVDEAAGFIGVAYLKLIEQTPSGTTVTQRSLAGTLDESFSWSVGAEKNSGSLAWATWVGAPISGAWSISITHVVSNVVGLLTQGAAVGPKSLETILEIKNWPYQSAGNNLVLVVGVATGAGTASGNTFISGSGTPGQVYLELSGSAIVNGTVTKVGVSSFAAGDFESDFGQAPDLQNQLVGKYGAQASVKLASITFPANASDIIYDPTQGSGTQPSAIPPPATGTTTTGSASKTEMISFVFALALALALLV